MQIDIRTLIFVLGITHLIQVVVFSHQYMINKTYRGIKWWLFWSAAELFGFTFLLLRQIPAFQIPAIILQNLFIISGVIFIYIGIMRFFEKKENIKLVLPIFVVFSLLFAYFLFFEDNLQMRSMLIAATLAVYAGITSHALLFYRPHQLRSTAGLTAVLFIIHCGFFLFRALYLIFGPEDEIFRATFMNVAMYTDALTSGLLWMLAFIIMINQQLIHDMKEAKEEMELVFETSPDAAIITRLSDGLIVFVNEGFSFLSGYTRQESIGRTTFDINLWVDAEDRRRVIDALAEKGQCNNFAAMFQKKDGSRIHGLMSARVIELQSGKHIISVTRDITELKHKENTLQETVNRLQKALEEIKTLRGIVPICANCKNIRDDDGYWQKVESYMARHSDVVFTHGICPDCMKRLYPDYNDSDS